MTPELIAWGALFVGLCGASITALVIGGKWIMRRLAERTAAATFEADFIPQAADVAEQDTTAIIEESLALLDDSLAHLARLRKAAGA